MSQRMTQLLLVMIAGLLAVNLFRSGTVMSTALAGESEKVPEVVRAQLFELVDQGGTVRSSLKLEPDGSVVFRLRDAQGRIRVKLGADEKGSGLVLIDEETEPAVHLLTSRSETTVTLAEKGKEKRVIEP